MLSNTSLHFRASCRFVVGACVLFLISTSSTFAAAGKIQFVAGEAKIINDKQAERAASKGEILNQGDSIVTGATGSVQVLLEDGGLLAVRPNTQMKIDAYAYSGKADDANNKSFFSLGKGTFRSITGAIGQNNKQAYRVSTPTATMGIRGTDHEPAVVLPLAPGTQPQSPLESAPPGTYDRVNQGQTFIQNSEGLVVLGVNQVGFASSAGGAPTVLPNVPSFYTSTPKPGDAKKDSKSTKSTSASSSAAGSTTSSGTSSTSSDSGSSDSSTTTASSSGDVAGDSGSFGVIGGTATSTSTTSSNVNTVTTVTSSPTIAAAATGTPITLLSGVVGANINFSGMMSSDFAGVLIADDPSKFIEIGAQNELNRVFDASTPPTFEALRNNAAIVDQGSFNAFADAGTAVYWGRWEDQGYIISEAGSPITAFGPFHYIHSPDITPVGLVTTPGALTGGNYTYVGGTSPSNFNGDVGSLTAASLNVNFSTQVVTLGISATVLDPMLSMVNLTGTAIGSVQNFVSDVGIVGFSGDPQRPMPTDTTLLAKGAFIGPTASGAITAFQLQDSQGNLAIGTAAFRR